jgi:hypothetical protein
MAGRDGAVNLFFWRPVIIAGAARHRPVERQQAQGRRDGLCLRLSRRKRSVTDCDAGRTLATTNEPSSDASSNTITLHHAHATTQLIFSFSPYPLLLALSRDLSARRVCCSLNDRWYPRVPSNVDRDRRAAGLPTTCPFRDVRIAPILFTLAQTTTACYLKYSLQLF